MSVLAFRIGSAVAAISLGLCGCGTMPKGQEPPLSSSLNSVRLDSVEARLEALSRQQQRTECLVRLSMVTTACMALYSGEPNGLALQNKLSTCVRSKGYPQGSDTCL